MIQSGRTTARGRHPFKRVVLSVILAGLAGYVMHTFRQALTASWDNDSFPDALAVKLELMPLVFPLHMVTGALALVLGPAAFFMRRRPHLHKLLGRIAATDIAIAGVTALPVALIAPVTRISAWGFAAQGLTWLTLLACGIIAIRTKRRALHRHCMILMLATTSGALFFRFYLALWALLGSWHHYETFYAIDAWIAWLLPLAAAQAWLGRLKRKQAVFSGGFDG